MWSKKLENTRTMRWFDKVPSFNLSTLERVALILRERQHCDDKQVADILGLTQENTDKLIKNLDRKLKP
ncbi:MAG: hypothetical protein JSR17_12320 [Proteobacteria bacterium]|nr:hypothetical protein [Pseudomonadota bacterium]